jgi:hypothetical protein
VVERLKAINARIDSLQQVNVMPPRRPRPSASNVDVSVIIHRYLVQEEEAQPRRRRMKATKD